MAKKTTEPPPENGLLSYIADEVKAMREEVRTDIRDMRSEIRELRDEHVVLVGNIVTPPMCQAHQKALVENFIDKREFRGGVRVVKWLGGGMMACIALLGVVLKWQEIVGLLSALGWLS